MGNPLVPAPAPAPAAAPAAAAPPAAPAVAAAAVAPPQPQADQNVTSDAAAIYQGGQFVQVTVADVVNNEVAVRQVMNALNLANQQKGELEKEVVALKVERASLVAIPAIAIFLGIVNVVGGILIGIGVNDMTGTPEVRNGLPLTVVGGVLVVASAVGPIILPSLIKRFRGRT